MTILLLLVLVLASRVVVGSKEVARRDAADGGPESAAVIDTEVFGGLPVRFMR